MSDDPHVGVVLASGGYPDHVEIGKRIDGLDRAAALDDVLVFHAATRREGDHLVTSGGRVLTIVGRGADVPRAIERAYAGVDAVSFEGMHVRRDIGKKATCRAWRTMPIHLCMLLASPRNRHVCRSRPQSCRYSLHSFLTSMRGIWEFCLTPAPVIISLLSIPHIGA